MSDKRYRLTRFLIIILFISSVVSHLGKLCILCLTSVSSTTTCVVEIHAVNFTGCRIKPRIEKNILGLILQKQMCVHIFIYLLLCIFTYIHEMRFLGHN